MNSAARFAPRSEDYQHYFERMGIAVTQRDIRRQQTWDTIIGLLWGTAAGGLALGVIWRVLR